MNLNVTQINLGTWKLTQVAIKRLEMKEHSRKDFTELIRQSVTELHCLNAYRHDNILPLYGYSIGKFSANLLVLLVDSCFNVRRTTSMFGIPIHARRVSGRSHKNSGSIKAT